MHYCRICGEKFRGFLDAVRHALSKHRDKMGEKDIRECEEWLKRKWSCRDCVHCGAIFFSPFPNGSITKCCPEGYLFNHPNPAEECPNFIPKVE